MLRNIKDRNFYIVCIGVLEETYIRQLADKEG
jgi:hypothetical protein